jgi:Coenzyme PQQ synthesis protein D (PqqD)
MGVPDQRSLCAGETKLDPSVVSRSGSYRVASAKIVWQCFEDELVVINLETGKYYSINATGAAIWKLMEAGWSPEASLSCLLDGVPAEEARRQVLAFWAGLLEEGLISPDPSQTGEPSGDVPAALPWSAPSIAVFSDMQELFLVDPIHDVDDAGWPSRPPEGN